MASRSYYLRYTLTNTGDVDSFKISDSRRNTYMAQRFYYLLCALTNREDADLFQIFWQSKKYVYGTAFFNIFAILSPTQTTSIRSKPSDSLRNTIWHSLYYLRYTLTNRDDVNLFQIFLQSKKYVYDTALFIILAIPLLTGTIDSFQVFLPVEKYTWFVLPYLLRDTLTQKTSIPVEFFDTPLNADTLHASFLSSLYHY